MRANVTDTQIAEWKASGQKYKVIAAHIAEWAAKQERGTVLENNEFFAGNLPFTASAEPWRQAKVFLAAVGVLYNDDGRPYQVA
jgi:hypothetical protein